MNAISQAEPKANGYNFVGTGEHEEAERSRALALLLENIGGKTLVTHKLQLRHWDNQKQLISGSKCPW